jgi:BirA family biotin operon repressor/biotin-[acetyl-CoA-carboxylase] ligase
MSNADCNQLHSCLSSSTPPRISTIEAWTLREYDEVASTNLVAASLAAWEAVRADTQTAGRGRFQRGWISDAGGLWLSAVLPLKFDAPGAGALPLAVGLAVCDALHESGAAGLRMRWPNDILVGDRKLAGLLIDRFNPWLAVAGIGVNVRNQPETCDDTLKNLTTRLLDLVAHPPTLRDLTTLVLRNLRKAVHEIAAGNFSAVLPRVNQLWDCPRRVELDLDGEILVGTFTGVDEGGRLILSAASGGSSAFEPWQVRHLKEMID